MTDADRRDWYTPAQRELLARLREAAADGAGIIVGVGGDGYELATARTLAAEGLVRIEVGYDEHGRPEWRLTPLGRAAQR